MAPSIRTTSVAGIVLAAVGCSSSTGYRQVALRPQTSDREVTEFSQIRPSGRGLEIGDRVRGELTSEDYIWEADGSHIQRWELPVGSNQEVTVDLISEELDTYLWVRGPGTQLQDDDGAGGCNSRITFRSTTNTDYQIFVNTIFSDVTGSFELEAYTGEPHPIETGACSGGGEATESCADAASTVNTGERFLARGRTVSGTLDERDFPCSDGSFLDGWTLSGNRGETLTIDLMSDDFDTYLYLAGPGQFATMTDDDSGGACNSRIEVQFPIAGEYTVAASSFNPAASGAYNIRVSDNSGPPRTGECPGGGIEDPLWSAAIINELPIDGRTIEVNESKDGFLSDEYGTTSNGAYRQAWRLEGEPGLFVSIDLESDLFDTFLVAYSTEFGVETNDDAGGGIDSRISVAVPEDGELIIVVSSFEAGRTGEFILSVEERERK